MTGGSTNSSLRNALPSTSGHARLQVCANSSAAQLVVVDALRLALRILVLQPEKRHGCQDVGE
eukprot:9466152-Lingulodinium_polyedra.AAC.1